MEMVESDKTIYSQMAGTETPWHHRAGIMGVVADGGYVSSDFRAALADGRATLEFTKAGDPSMRGIVERIFRTVAVRLMARLKGKTFSDIFERANYDSAANAGLTIDELAWILVTWVVDIYHNTPHEGLKGLTPNEAWDEALEKHGVHPWRDAHGRRSAYGVRLKRKIRERGFNVLGNWYRDDDPEGARGLYFNSHDDEREFEIAFDTSNLGAISVIVGDVAIAVPCRDPKMEGVSAEDWIAMNSKLRKENEIRTQFPRAIAHQAMERILEVNKTAHARSLIARKAYAKEEIDALEKGLFKRIEFVDPAEGESSDILGESIEAIDLGSLPSLKDLTGDAPAETDSAAVGAEFPSPDTSDKWTMND
jgi:putative transposase